MTKDRGAFAIGDATKRIKTNVLDDVQGHVSIRVPPLWAVGDKQVDAQIDVPVRNGLVRIMDVEARIGALSFGVEEVVDRVSSPLKEKIDAEGTIPVAKLVEILNARSGADTGMANKGPLLDTDTGPSSFMQGIEVKTHLTNIQGKVEVGVDTSVDIAKAGVYADGSMNKMKAGVTDLEVPRAAHGDTKAAGIKADRIDVEARDLGDPDKRLTVRVRRGHIDKVESGDGEIIKEGRKVSPKDPSEER